MKIKLRWSDFTYSTRQGTLPFATDATPVIKETATSLLTRLWLDAAPVRLLGVGVSGLSPVRQLGLFDNMPEEDGTPAETQTREEEATETVALVPENAEPERVEPDHHHLEQRRQRLHEALAELEARFGSDIIHFGVRSTQRGERIG